MKKHSVSAVVVMLNRLNRSVAWTNGVTFPGIYNVSNGYFVVWPDGPL
jgi:hypothetical protein